VIQDQKIKWLNFGSIVDIILYYRDKILTAITIMTHLTTLQIATLVRKAKRANFGDQKLSYT
jgi:undecaprenyl pyrophosphate phosphatase UppP